MGRQRDPKRDEALDIYKANDGKISLIEIATKLGVSDGTVRGWKAKDKWESLLSHGEAAGDTEETNIAEEAEEVDELFMDAVKIIIDAQQASVSLLQRRLRTGYTRAARLIDKMEHLGIVGPYIGSQPRKVLISDISQLPSVKVISSEEDKERNVPVKQSERTNNTERSEKIKNVPVKSEPDLPEEVDDTGLTMKQRLFCIYYVKTFNGTQAAISAGYSHDSAHVEGSRLLRHAKVSEEIKRIKANMAHALFIDAMDVLNKYVAIAFADIKDYVEFGQQEVPVMTEDGPVIKPDGDMLMTKQSFVSFRNSSEVDGTIISEVKEGKDGVSVKLHDKMKALEILIKYFDLLPDKHKRMIEEEKLKISREKLEIERDKGDGGESDSGNIDQLTEMIRLSAEAARKKGAE